MYVAGLFRWTVSRAETATAIRSTLIRRIPNYYLQATPKLMEATARAGQAFFTEHQHDSACLSLDGVSPGVLAPRSGIRRCPGRPSGEVVEQGKPKLSERLQGRTVTNVSLQCFGKNLLGGPAKGFLAELQPSCWHLPPALPQRQNFTQSGM